MAALGKLGATERAGALDQLSKFLP